MTSITELARRASNGNESAVATLWVTYKDRLIERAGHVLKRYHISSTEPEEVATTVFAECTMWTQNSDAEIENRKAYWALLSRATIFHGRKVLNHEMKDKRPNIWKAESLDESRVPCESDERQIMVRDEYLGLLKRHPSASVILPMLIDRKPMDAIANRLGISVRSTYRIVSQLTRELRERLYD
jgi:ECF sigma factor